MNVAVLGLGLMGDVGVRAFTRDPRWRVVLVADPSQERRERALALCPGALALPDAGAAVAREALDRCDVDLALVATPPDTHAALAVAALEHGRHVICEKPFARDAAEAAGMVSAAAARPHLVALVDHQLRYTRARRWLRERIAAGDLGVVRHVQLAASFPALADAPWSWWSQRAAGGGLLNEYGSHAIDLLRWMLGEPTTAAGVLRTVVTERLDGDVARPADSDDLASFRLAWSGGAFADVLLSGVAAPRDQRLRVHGDAGTIELDARDQVTWFRRDGAVEQLDLGETGKSLIDSPTDVFSQPFVRLLDALAGALERGAAPADAATFADGLAVMRIIDAVRASAGADATEVATTP